MGNHVVNLTFHGIGDPPASADPGEAAVWVTKPRYREILDQIRGRDEVQLSFDDGNASDLRVGLPELLARDLRADFFVIVDLIGQPGYLSLDGLRELKAAGCGVGSHGLAHRAWRGLEVEALRAEVEDSKHRLEDWLGASVEHAACPFGAYDRRALRALRQAGYARVYTSDGGHDSPSAWLQARTSIHRSDTIEDVGKMLHDNHWLAQTKRRAKRMLKRWR